jgi:hypothetical protein
MNKRIRKTGMIAASKVVAEQKLQGKKQLSSISVERQVLGYVTITDHAKY